LADLAAMARLHDRFTHLARRACFAASLGIALLALSGCGEINDMLDAGKEKKPAAAETAAKADPAGQSAKAKLDAYYKRESRQVQHDPNDPIVSCNLRGKRQYMRRSDCALRGGHE
jgi:hypothetical protein